MDQRVIPPGIDHPQPENYEPEIIDNRWSASRQRSRAREKELMAAYFVEHHFLVREHPDRSGHIDGAEPDQHETVASIIVNQGTTPHAVVRTALAWVKTKATKEHLSGAFFLSWFTPGLLVPNELREFCKHNPQLSAAARAFVFPGEVNYETDSVSGPVAEEFVKRLTRRFTYAILSAYSFDLSTGDVFFYNTAELELQKACATREAAHKFLFLDSSKLMGEEEKGYSVRDLLLKSRTVTLYTVSWSEEQTAHLKKDFKSLCKHIADRSPFAEAPSQEAGGALRLKSAPRTLRLQIVGAEATADQGVEFRLVLRS
jgi:hypothetical protein